MRPRMRPRRSSMETRSRSRLAPQVGAIGVPQSLGRRRRQRAQRGVANVARSRGASRLQTVVCGRSSLQGCRMTDRVCSAPRNAPHSQLHSLAWARALRPYTKSDGVRAVRELAVTAMGLASIVYAMVWAIEIELALSSTRFEGRLVSVSRAARSRRSEEHRRKKDPPKRARDPWGGCIFEDAVEILYHVPSALRSVAHNSRRLVARGSSPLSACLRLCSRHGDNRRAGHDEQRRVIRRKRPHA